MADLQIINAVIDLGTNTCNLLIAECFESGTFRVLHEERIAVKMGRLVEYTKKNCFLKRWREG